MSCSSWFGVRPALLRSLMLNLSCRSPTHIGCHIWRQSYWSCMLLFFILDFVFFSGAETSEHVVLFVIGTCSRAPAGGEACGAAQTSLVGGMCVCVREPVHHRRCLSVKRFFKKKQQLYWPAGRIFCCVFCFFVCWLSPSWKQNAGKHFLSFCLCTSFEV